MSYANMQRLVELTKGQPLEVAQQRIADIFSFDDVTDGEFNYLLCWLDDHYNVGYKKLLEKV
jgi:hypothetical protein